MAFVTSTFQTLLAAKSFESAREYALRFQKGTYADLAERFIENTVSTTIAVASNGVSLPTGTINVADTSKFPSSGTIIVKTNQALLQAVTFTGKTSTSFTGCLLGSGAMATGGAVVGHAPSQFGAFKYVYG